MDADEKARELALNLLLAHTYKTDYSPSPPVSQVDRNGLRDAIAAALRDAADEARREERERCARVVEGGRFLHDDAPAARFAREAAKAIRTLDERRAAD